jgi:hypothetical protein
LPSKLPSNLWDFREHEYNSEDTELKGYIYGLLTGLETKELLQN